MRKIFLIFFFMMVATILFLGYIKLFNGKSKKQLITLFNWGEFIDNDILEKFNKYDPDFEIKQNFFSSNETAINKIKTGNNYDLAILSEYAIEQLKEENYLTKIPFDKINSEKLKLKDTFTNIIKQNPNLEKIFNNNNSVDDGTYALPYAWGTVGLLYKKEKIKNIKENWEQEFRKVDNKIAFYNNPKDIFLIGLKAIGGNIAQPTDTEIKEAAEWLIGIKQNSNISFINDQILDQMQEKDKECYDIAVVYSGDAEYLMKKNSNLEYYIFNHFPTSLGTNVWIDGIVMPRGTNPEKSEGVYRFIKHLFEAKYLKQNYEYIGYYSPYEGIIVESETEKDYQQHTHDKNVVYKFDKILNKKILGEWDRVYTQPIKGDNWIFLLSGLIIIFILFFYAKNKIKNNRCQNFFQTIF